MSKLREEIIKRFRDPKYGYKGKYIFYKELKNEFPNITLNRVKEILDSNKDYSIYKPIPKNIYFRFTVDFMEHTKQILLICLLMM